MFRDPCETRVFGDPCVGREGERLVCYRNRVLLARSCVQRVRERVAIVYSSLLGIWAVGTVGSCFSDSSCTRLSEHSALTDGYTIWDGSSN